MSDQQHQDHLEARYEQRYQDHLADQYRSQERDYLKAKVDELARALARSDDTDSCCGCGIATSRFSACDPDCVRVWAIDHVAELENQ